MAEARNIDNGTVKKIDMLLKYFNQQFALLYTVKTGLTTKSRFSM